MWRPAPTEDPGCGALSGAGDHKGQAGDHKGRPYGER